MFKALGALLVIYTVYAAVEGKVFAKSGVRADRVLSNCWRLIANGCANSRAPGNCDEHA